jgi:hypothetical protein
MTRIGLLSDTHHYLDDSIFRHLEECDEIWHAGDFGTVSVANTLKALKPLRGVYGNIDGQDIRSIYPEKMIWKQEEIEVYMTHIGGYPPRYNPALKKDLIETCPQLFICGHSHILKVMYDEALQCLHMNPGAAGNHGWHKIRTLLRFTVDGKQIKDCEVIELGKRGTS